MLEIDADLLSNELDIAGLLAIQVILGVITLSLGLCAGRWSGRRWVGAGFLLVLLVAAAACGGTLYRCSEARDSTRGRLEHRIPGQQLPQERGQNHLDAVWNYGLASVATLGATFIESGLLYGRVSWRRRTV
jgi:hypothetical protein